MAYREKHFKTNSWTKKERTISTKVQDRSHIDIIDVGRLLSRQREEFSERRHDTELTELKTQIRQYIYEHHRDEVANLQQQFEIICEKVRKKSLTHLERIFIATSSFVHENKMKDYKADSQIKSKGEVLLRNTIFQSMKKLLLEKDIAIGEIKKFERLQTERKIKELMMENDVICQERICEWKDDIQAKLSGVKQHYKNMKHKLEKEMRESYETKLSVLISNENENHHKKINEIKANLYKENLLSEDFISQKKFLASKGDSIIPYMYYILQRYRQIIESNTLFAEGQSDFILHELVPHSFYESLMVNENEGGT